MGLTTNGVRSLLYAKSLGVDFSQTAMIGRLYFYLSPSDLMYILAEFGFSFDEPTISRIYSANGGYTEEFIGWLGAKEVHSFDYSAYEGATHLHDMNQEISDRFRQQYTAMLDYGSLEHIFNLPTAIKNCMEMVKVGGHYIALTPANNNMGHGFYQFSPELFFSLFTAANGYQLINVFAFEDTANARWYSVKSPASVNGRVTLDNSKPVSLLVIAKRIENIAPLTSMPQQSDYISTWQKVNGDMETDRSVKRHNGLVAFALRHTPYPVKYRIKQIARRLLGCFARPSGFNPRFFQPFDPTDYIKTAQQNAHPRD